MSSLRSSAACCGPDTGFAASAGVVNISQSHVVLVESGDALQRWVDEGLVRQRLRVGRANHLPNWRSNGELRTPPVQFRQPRLRRRVNSLSCRIAKYRNLILGGAARSHDIPGKRRKSQHLHEVAAVIRQLFAAIVTVRIGLFEGDT